jgi:hypothetical protein
LAFSQARKMKKNIQEGETSSGSWIFQRFELNPAQEVHWLLVASVAASVRLTSR